MLHRPNAEEDLEKLNKADEYDEELYLTTEVHVYIQGVYKVRCLRAHVDSALICL